MVEDPALFLVSCTPEGFCGAIRRLVQGQDKRFRFFGDDPLADRVATQLVGEFRSAVEIRRSPDAASADPSALARDEVAVLFHTSGEALSAALHRFVNAPARIVAAQTDHYYSRRAYFLITIPKAGFHLLGPLLNDMGIAPGKRIESEPAPGRWHTLMYDHPHSPAQDFFEKLKNEPIGGANHPFFRTPCIFLYRHPADIVISEMHYFERANVSALHHYFAPMEREKRLAELISGNSPAGDIGMRIGAYTPWLRLGNVIPISYEEIVGPRGNGSAEEQIRCLWSLQVKLHIPGRTQHYASLSQNTRSLTFCNGKINNYRTNFTGLHKRLFASFSASCLEAFGYNFDEGSMVDFVPSRAQEFRSRPLRLAKPAEFPVAQDSTELRDDRVYRYGGYHVMRGGGRYWAVPRGHEPFNPVVDMPPPKTKLAATLSELRNAIDRDPLSIGETLLKETTTSRFFVMRYESEPKLLKSKVNGHNIVQYGNRFYALPLSVGEVDFNFGLPDELRGVIIASSLREAETAARATGRGPVRIAKNLIYWIIIFCLQLLRVAGLRFNGRHGSRNCPPSQVHDLQ